MPRVAAAVLAALFALPALACAAHDHLVVRDVHARAVPPTAMASAAYMTIENPGPADDRLVAARSDVAARVELHTHVLEDGIAKMRALAEGVATPAGASVAFAPGGLHVMLMGLSQPLTPGARFPLTLVFERAGELTVEVEVRDLSRGPADGSMSHGHDHAPVTN
jgi:copper(I)-binding protein